MFPMQMQAGLHVLHILAWSAGVVALVHISWFHPESEEVYGGTVADFLGWSPDYTSDAKEILPHINRTQFGLKTLSVCW